MKDKVLGLIRHALTTAGGSLVAGGVLVETDLMAIIGGIVTAAGVVWSYVEKQQREKKEAAKAPTPS